MTTSLQTPPALAKIPDTLRPLVELAYNLWWTWNRDAMALFERLDEDLWRRAKCNPVRVLLEVSPERLDAAANDTDFVRDLGVCADRFRAHISGPLRASESPSTDPAARPFKAAYFCAEFGLAECLDTYAGGLGLLAGDHLKSASGLALPLVAVGLLYKNGYFRQVIDAAGMQEEAFPRVEPAHQPLRRCTDASTGEQKRIQVDLPGRAVQAAIWRADAGRIPLYLLDTDVPENQPRDREITRNLYLGDHDMRIRQEIVLGIGGVRALAAVGEEPTVCHMNEGHSAFMALERTRVVRERHGVTFDQAREATAASHVFTTHTPVPAGIDRFSPELIKRYFDGYAVSLGLDMEGLLALGRENVADRNEFFSMAVLAIRMSRFCNGVSRLHGEVSRGMWRDIWPGTPRDDVPIGHVTNGVHTQGWAGPEVTELFEKTLGPAWRERPQDEQTWQGIDSIDDRELWALRCAARKSLVEWCRQRAAGQDRAQSNPLDADALTIGFARRFAAYKRGTLLFRDPDRLERLLKADRPIQLIVSGKAHPGDPSGKRLIQDIIRYARERRVEDRVVFIEDYDIGVARRLVHGCDVWLNTPIRGLEASGTSGMKAALNGVINVSTLDGWWDEGYAPDLGFHIDSIGTFDHDLPNQQREDFESDSLYRLIEHQLVPEFYEREEGVPRKWIARMKRCIAALAPVFSTHRMVAEYAQRYYFPAHFASAALERDGLKNAVALSNQVGRLRAHWKAIRITDAQCHPARSGSMADISAVIELDGLEPADVRVQVRHGALDRHGELAAAAALDMQHEKDLREGAHRFALRFTPARSPRAAWCVRIIPGDPRLITPFIPGLIVSGPVQQAEAHAAANE